MLINHSPSIFVVMSINISFFRGLEGPAQANCIADGLEIIPVVRVGGRVIVMEPNGKSVIDEPLVVHEIGANEGDDIVALVDGNIKVGNGWSGRHAHGNSTNLEKD